MTKKAISLGGVHYSSISEAAEKLKTTRKMIRVWVKNADAYERMVERGRLNLGNAASPIEIRGVEYPSHTIAAEVLGVTRQAIAQAKYRGTLATVGLGRTGRPCQQP